jgi:GNAT superfamily N-acetyltransferase
MPLEHLTIRGSEIIIRPLDPVRDIGAYTHYLHHASIAPYFRKHGPLVREPKREPKKKLHIKKSAGPIQQALGRFRSNTVQAQWISTQMNIGVPFGRMPPKTTLRWTITTNRGAFVGNIGATVHGRNIVEMGYWIAPPARNKGYASAAAKEVVQWLDKNGAENLMAIVRPKNKGSHKAIQSAGFTTKKPMRTYPGRTATAQVIYRRRNPALG